MGTCAQCKSMISTEFVKILYTIFIFSNTQLCGSLSGSLLAKNFFLMNYAIDSKTLDVG